jgi:hypothetical protein
LTRRILFTLLALGVVFGGGTVALDAADGLELRDGDRIVLLGNTLIERAQTYGYLETSLTIRAPAYIPERQAQAGIPDGQRGLQVAIGLSPLDERVSKKNDPVAVSKLKAIGRIQRNGPSPENNTQGQQCKKNPSSQNSVPAKWLSIN